MNNLRFALLSIAVFATAFAGMSWFARGRSVAAVEPPKTLAAHIPETADRELPQVARAPSPGDAAPKLLMQPQPMPPPRPAAPPEVKPAAEPAPPRDSQNGRDLLRATAIRTAAGYARTPCDPAARAAFIVAASSYIRGEETADPAARSAIGRALGTGGIATDEFPPGVQGWIAELPATARPLACPVGRQAARSM